MTEATPDANGRTEKPRTAEQDAQRGLPAGLVPVAFSFTRLRVRLLDFSGVELHEQSFRQTAERWQADHPQLTPVEMSWSAYLTAARQTPGSPLAGFLFNVARCGSTLLANMLGALPGSVVVKESATVALLVRRLLAARTEPERQEIADLLTTTLPLYNQIASVPGDSATASQPAPCVFVKPHSSLMVGAATLLELFPEAPAIFLYRNPFEVVASMLAKPPYGGLYDLPREEVVPGFPSLAGAPACVSRAGFHAHLWRSPVEAALALPPERLLFMDYAELVADPVAAIGRLTDYLRIKPSPETVARLAGLMGTYSKDASGQTRFDGAGEHHRPSLDADQRAEVRMVAGDLYDQLEARRYGQMSATV